jgi:hypothetical protein
MKKDMPLEGLRWSRDSGSALYDTPPNGRSRTGWGGGSLTAFPNDDGNKLDTLTGIGTILILELKSSNILCGLNLFQVV